MVEGGQASIVIQNGQVLLIGGVDNAGTSLATAELYDPVSGTFTPTGSLSQARERHTMTLLPNGKVLAAGGRIFTNGAFSILSSAELFDPQASEGETAVASSNAESAFSNEVSVIVPSS